MKLPLKATSISTLNLALKALPRHALEQFADRVFTLLYLECEEPNLKMEVNPDKEWDQSAIEEVDTALREILDPRGGALPRKPKPTFQDRGYKIGYLTLGHLLNMAVESDRGYKIGYLTLGHLLNMAVESDRVTAREASVAMKAWEKEDAHSPDWAWDETAGPCLDRLAEIVKQIAANPNETPKY